MKKTIKFINEFYYYDRELKLTITFKRDEIIDEDNKYFNDIYNKSKDYYIEIKIEQPKAEEIVIEEKEEIKDIKKTKNKFFKNKK